MILFNREKISLYCLGICRLLAMLAAVLFISVPLAVSAQTVDKPGLWIPPVVKVANVGMGGVWAGQGGKRWLSVGADGSYADLYDNDDNSGRQRWYFQRSLDGVSYNILVGGGTPSNRKYLSVTADGSKVDLFDRDDSSGRQRWIVELAPNSVAKYRIYIKGGVNNNRKYLSTTSDGSKVDLYYTDDGSHRQWWDFAIPNGVKFNVQISGGVSSGRTLLSIPASGAFVDLYDKDDNSGRQRWSLEIVSYGGFYRNLMSGKCLTFDDKNNKPVTGVSLTPCDSSNDGNYWEIEDVGSGLVRFRPNRRTNRFLSVAADGSKVDVFDRDDGSGRQRWKVSIAPSN